MKNPLLYSLIYLLFLFLCMVEYSISKVSYFNEEKIDKEIQIFNFKERVSLDSVSFDFIVNNKDTILISLYKDRNFLFTKVEPYLVYTDTLVPSSFGLNSSTIDLTNNNIDIIREELIFEFESLYDKSRLIIKEGIDTTDCNGVILGRKQKFIKNGKEINGIENYEVVTFFNQYTDDKDFVFHLDTNIINESRKYNKNSNLLVFDANEDSFLDLIIENHLYLNDKNGNYKLYETFDIGENQESLNQVFDLNNDGHLELIRFFPNDTTQIFSFNSKLELINIVELSNSLNITKTDKILFHDIDNDDLIDFVIIENNKLKFIKNDYPNFNYDSIFTEYPIKNISLAATNNTPIIHTNDSQVKIKDFSLDSKSLFVREDKNNESRITYIDNIQLSEDIINLSTDDSIFELKRIVLAPSQIYEVKFSNNTESNIVIVSRNNCQKNIVLTKNKEKLNDISEVTNLKFLNLKNSIFFDSDNDGNIELLINDNGFLKVYKLSNVSLEYYNVSNSSYDSAHFELYESRLLIASQHYGLNQLLFYKNSNALQSVFPYNNFYNSQTIPIRTDETSLYKIDVKTDYDNDQITFSSTEKIIELKIIGLDGKMVYSLNNINKNELVLNGDEFLVNVSQSIYFYSVVTEENKEVIKGNFLWVK